MMVDLVVFFLVHDSMLKSQFLTAVGSQEHFFQNLLEIGFFEVLEVNLVLGVKELFFFVGDLHIDNVQNRVVKSHTER